MWRSWFRRLDGDLTWSFLPQRDHRHECRQDLTAYLRDNNIDRRRLTVVVLAVGERPDGPTSIPDGDVSVVWDGRVWPMNETPDF